LISHSREAPRSERRPRPIGRTGGDGRSIAASFGAVRFRASEPYAIRQWVVCVGLVLDAEDRIRAGSSIARAVGLITADTAIEATLALLSSRNLDPLTGDGFGVYLSRAKAVAKLSDRIHRDLVAVHKIRNGAVHSSAEVSADDLVRAATVARELLDTYVPRVLRRTHALGHGSGIGDAVGALLDPHPISRHLVAAQTSIARGRPEASLESSARAFYAAKSHALPPLPNLRLRLPDVAPHASGLAPEARRTIDRVNVRVSTVADTVDQIEDWVIPLALGLPPTTYASLESELPALWGTSAEAHWQDNDPPSLDVAKRCLERVSLVALRLWLGEMLSYPPVDLHPSNIWEEISAAWSDTERVPQER